MEDVNSGRDELQCEERPLRHAGLKDTYRPDTAHEERMAGHPVHGAMRRLTVREGINISCFDLISPSPFHGTARSEPTLTVALLLDCAGRSFVRSSMANASLELPYHPGTLIYCFTRAVTEGSYEVPAQTRFRGVEVRLSHEYLERLGALELMHKAGADHPFHTVSNVDLWLGTVPAPLEAKVCAERILEAAFLPQSDDLAIETNGLAILNLALSAMRATSGGSEAEIRQCRPQLEKARRLLLDNSAQDWSISRLANEVGLTEKRLKSGFRTAFGTPVHAFLQGVRLSRARQLLEAGGMSVTEVSLSVGYANPSHFAHLYRRTFGATPSNTLGPSPGRRRTT